MRFILSLIIVVVFLSFIITPLLPKIKLYFHKYLHKLDGYLTNSNKADDKNE